MILWRIATETRRYKATDLTGGGAAASPGRWNEDNQPVVYAAPAGRDWCTCSDFPESAHARCPQPGRSMRVAEPLSVRQVTPLADAQDILDLRSFIRCVYRFSGCVLTVISSGSPPDPR